ncbi:MAG: LPS translocon maturation chaperone LptM [Alphaproteobacteria bacterium]|jgi:predicted small lipoprotein YifL|nr:lipoprotein [Candidatus Jidaibacter sp.]
MKEFFKIFLVSLISLSLLSACGIKGKLDLPDESEGEILDR